MYGASVSWGHWLSATAVRCFPQEFERLWGEDVRASRVAERAVLSLDTGHVQYRYI